MCLTSNHFLPKFTFKPKKVYKVLFVVDDEDHSPKYVSPVADFEYELGKEYHSYPSFKGWFAKYKDRGFIHSYVTLLMAKASSIFYGRPKVLVECEIPRFSFYYDGKNGDICSTKLRITNNIIHVFAE